MESDQHRTRQWAVGTLCFNNPPMNEVTSETLVRLPKRQGGALTISGSGVFIRTYVLHAEVSLLTYLLASIVVATIQLASTTRSCALSHTVIRVGKILPTHSCVKVLIVH